MGLLARGMFAAGLGCAAAPGAFLKKLCSTHLGFDSLHDLLKFVLRVNVFMAC